MSFSYVEIILDVGVYIRRRKGKEEIDCFFYTIFLNFMRRRVIYDYQIFQPFLEWSISTSQLNAYFA
jgi:hypothetical protein